MGVDGGRRGELQSQLMAYLDRSEGLELAASVLRPECEDRDAELGFYCAVLLHDVGRRRFGELGEEDRTALAKAVFAVMCSGRYPQFLNTKLAGVVVQFGKRELIASNGNGEKIRKGVIAMVMEMSQAENRDANVSTSALEVLSVLVQDSLDTVRTDLLSRDRQNYRAIIRSQAKQLATALSKGLQATGPYPPPHFLHLTFPPPNKKQRKRNKHTPDSCHSRRRVFPKTTPHRLWPTTTKKPPKKTSTPQLHHISTARQIRRLQHSLPKLCMD